MLSTATELTLPQYRAQLEQFLSDLPANSPEMVNVLRQLSRTDLFFLLVNVLGRKDLDDPWHYDRIREVQAEPDGGIWIWFRESGKSSISNALIIQNILQSHGQDPLPVWEGREPCFLIMSHVRPLAKGFLRSIQQELVGNEMLKSLFPDILYEDPQKESPRWSLDDGIVVRRETNRVEGTVEASGCVDGQPTGKHFDVLVWDDISVLDSVRTADMIKKVRESWEMSLNLGVHRGKRRMIGTRYSHADLYGEIIKRKVFTPRIYPATHDGTVTGDPVLWDRETISQKRKEMGSYVFASQLLCDPLADSGHSFNPEWFGRWHTKPQWERMPRVLICDPANTQNRWSDYTSMWVVALGEDDVYYVLDGLRDRLKLRARTDALIDLHREWQPLGTFYERYGAIADVDYIQEIQDKRSYRFVVTELGGTKLSKEDRIARLGPYFEGARIMFPAVLQKTDYEGKVYDLTTVVYEEEYLTFPVGSHDDSLDCLARICDEEVAEKLKRPRSRQYSPRERARMFEAMPRPFIV